MIVSIGPFRRSQEPGNYKTIAHESDRLGVHGRRLNSAFTFRMSLELRLRRAQTQLCTCIEILAVGFGRGRGCCLPASGMVVDLEIEEYAWIWHQKVSVEEIE